ncbi:MAG: hypothetical protein WKF55_15700 [Gemmatimonadaceae bacterium]
MKSVTIKPRAAWLDEASPAGIGPIADQERFEAAESNRIVVPGRVEDPHPLVAQTIIALRRAKPDSNGVLKPKGDCLDVQVTLDSSDRTMCILDALIKALDLRGYRTTIRRNGENVSTSVRIIEEDIAISLSEQVNRVERKDEKRKQSEWGFPHYDWVPTGRLSLRIQSWSPGTRQSWSDGKQQRLESCLNRFIVGLVVCAEAARAGRLEREEREREYREAEEKRLLELRRREEEAARARALIHAADQWETAQTIRRYLMQVRGSLEHRPDVPLEMREWLKWAQEFVDRIDPLLPEPSIPVDPQPPDRSRYGW